jgi:hypothetical protein
VRDIKKCIGERHQRREIGEEARRSLKRFIAFVMDAGNFQGLSVEENFYRIV